MLDEKGVWRERGCENLVFQLWDGEAVFLMGLAGETGWLVHGRKNGLGAEFVCVYIDM